MKRLALSLASFLLVGATAWAEVVVRATVVPAADVVVDEASGSVTVVPSDALSQPLVRLIRVDAPSGRFGVDALGAPGDEIVIDDSAERLYVIKRGPASASGDLEILEVGLAANGLAYEPVTNSLNLRDFLASGDRPGSRFLSGDYDVRQISLATNDIAFDETSGLIYASTPSSAGMLGNSIVPIDPATGAIGTPVFVGSEPGVLARSDDGQFLYVSLDGAAAVRRFDLATQTPGLQFALGSHASYGPYYAEDIEVMPGDPGVVAISLMNLGISPRHAGVAIYDDGVARPNTTQRHTGSNRIEFSDDPGLLYGYNNASTEFGFRKIAVDEDGATELSVYRNFIMGFNVDIEYHGGRVYATTGIVLDPDLPSVLGSYTGFSFARSVSVDASRDLVYFLTSSELRIYRLSTFIPLVTLTPGISGTPGSLVSWGPDRLAFRDGNGRVFFVDGQADLSITMTDSADPAPLGTAFSYWLTVGNDGPAAAADVVVTDTLPGNLGFVQALASQGSCSETGGTVTCSLGSLPPSASATVEIVVTADGTGMASNTATVSASRTDPDPANDSATETTLVRVVGEMLATKTVTGDFRERGLVTYAVVITQVGSATQGDNPGHEFSDALPASLTALSATASSGVVVRNRNLVNWNGSLAPTESVSLVIRALVNSGTAGATISNQGTVSYDADADGTNETVLPTDDPGLPGATDATSFVVEAQPPLRLFRAALPGELTEAGDTSP